MSGPEVRLNTGHVIPQLGIGTYLIPAEDTERLVAEALEIGFRHIDAAAAYGNEREIGRAIAASGIPRDELFVTTKLWNDRHAGDEPLRAIDESLERLGLDRVDLYLIHWPVPAQDLYVHAWRQLERIRDDGRATSIGVSNFTAAYLDRLAAETDTVPAVNQVELHPIFQQTELVGLARARGIVTEAWSPLGRGRYPLLEDEVVTGIAAAHGVSPAQAVLRWHLHRGHVIFPKTERVERLRENFAILDFQLDPAEVAAIDALNREERLGLDPSAQDPARRPSV